MGLAAVAVITFALIPVGGGELGLLGVHLTAAADERSDAEANRSDAQRRQAELTSSLEGVSKELGQAYLDLQNATTSLQTAETELSKAETTLAQKEREQKTASDRLDVAKAEQQTLNSQSDAANQHLSENQTAIADLVVATYQGDNSLNSWSFVLSSESVGDLTTRAASIEIAAGVEQDVLTQAENERSKTANRKARQDAVATRVTTLKTEADAAKKAASEAKDTAKTKRDEVATLKATKQSAVNTFEEQKKTLESQQTKAKQDEANANATIARLEEENRKAIQQQGGGSSGGGSGGGGGNAANNLGGGSIAHPISGPLIVTSPFGMRLHPILGYYRLHDGVDLAAGTGVPQYAAISGSVTTSWDDSCGNAVFINGVVDGNSVILKYCHLSAFSVSAGQQVSQGAQIGLTGSTGGVTGPHVHFSVRINGSFVDPMSLPGF
ncbi:Glycyl-glycine endopeptidase ALE-1 precursor [Actinomyces bovis]|uniref:Glycyl-glycine endopeptidase ALE-1 n=2 Tax=Actinomyces bovis TaxID=1658 RepID=A0ABY1VNY3_9ACTO|nr:Glycyl-glycine endopeptidase ALE-1 precursor [Actinomyces bovis]VEG53179.1 Glycyl-glycine endopeptidase ALE-1 precursor [Actinomyces israelii]